MFFYSPNGNLQNGPKVAGVRKTTRGRDYRDFFSTIRFLGHFYCRNQIRIRTHDDGAIKLVRQCILDQMNGDIYISFLFFVTLPPNAALLALSHLALETSHDGLNTKAFERTNVLPVSRERTGKPSGKRGEVFDRNQLFVRS